MMTYGNLIITVEAKNEKGEKERFEIESYVSSKIKPAEKFTDIGSIAFYSAKLRGLYFPEIIEIKEKK